MKKHTSKILLATFLLSTQVYAFDLQSLPIEWKRVQAQFVTSQQSIGDSYSGALAWSPRYKFDEKLSASSILSMSPQKKSGEGTFLETSLQLQGHWSFAPEHTVTASLGLQNWTCKGCGTVGVYSAGYVNDLSRVPELKQYVDEGFVRYQTRNH